MASASASASVSGTRSFINSCSASSSTIARTARIPMYGHCHSRALHSTAHSPLSLAVATQQRSLFSIPYSGQPNQIPGSTSTRTSFSCKPCRYMSGSGHDPSRMAPPGTFVTGTHWDKPAQTKPLSVVSAAPTKLGIGNTTPTATASRTTPNPKASARIWDSLKDQISSELAPESPSNTELNKKKLEAISKGKVESKQQGCSWTIGNHREE